MNEQRSEAVFSASRPHASARSTSLRWLVSLVALAVAAVYFLARGPARALPDGGIDFQYCLYVALRTFAHGGDPYRSEDFVATARALSDSHYNLSKDYYKDAVLYAPGFFALGPLGLLPSWLAAWAWLLMQAAAFAALLLWAWRLFSLSEENRLPWVIFLACALCLAPAHTSFAVGNTGILFSALAAGLFLALERRASTWGGLALGLLMLKPTFGVPAAVVVAVRRRWRTLAIAALVCLATSLPLFWHLGVRNTIEGLLRNVAASTQPGMPNDESLLNPQHYQLLNLRAWSLTLIGRGWAEITTIGVLALILYGLIRFRHRPAGVDSALYWTLASSFLCLTMYHRFYDATILVISIAAAFDFRANRSKFAWAWAAALAPFAVPGTAWMHLNWGELAHRYPLVEALVVRHQTVALMLLAGLSIAGLWKTKLS